MRMLRDTSKGHPALVAASQTSSPGCRPDARMPRVQTPACSCAAHACRSRAHAHCCRAYARLMKRCSCGEAL